MRYKTMLRSAPLAVGMMLLVACGGGDAEPEGQTEGEATAEAAAADCGDAITMRVGHQIADTSPLQQGGLKLEEIVEAETDGRIDVQVFPAAQLGSETELLEQNQAGTVEMSFPSPAVLSNIYPDAATFAMPYVLEGSNEEEMYASLQKAAESDVVAEMTEEMSQEHGLRALDWTWWYGNRHITNSVRPTETADDIAGLQLRTPDAEVHFLALRNLGAEVVPLAFSELYLALQLGTVDGQENPTSTIETQKLYEVQDHLAVTGHMSQAEAPVISEKFWQTLCESDQQIIEDAVIEAGKHQSQIALEENAAALDRLAEQGMQITEPDVEALRQATEGAAQEWAEKSPDFSMERYQAFVESQG